RVEPVGIRQRQIEEDHIRYFAAQRFPRGFETIDMGQPVLETRLLLKQLTQKAGVAEVVLDQQDSDRARFHSVRRQLDDREPEILDRLDHVDELVQVHRLGHIAVRVEVVRAHDVLLRFRTRQDYHWYIAQRRVRLDLLEHLPAILLGKVEVEQDQVGT